MKFDKVTLLATKAALPIRKQSFSYKKKCVSNFHAQT